MYRVLIVEDEQLIREGFKRTIEWERYGLAIVGEAKDGEEGLILAEMHRPHLIFADVRMPGMDGLQFAERALRLLPDTKIVIVSGYKDYDYFRHSLQLGLFDYLLKPVDEDELIRVVENAVRKIDQSQTDKRKEIEAHSRMRRSEDVLHDVLLSRLAAGDLSPLKEWMPDPYLQHIAFDGYAAAVLRVDNYHKLVRDEYAGDEEALLFAVVNICEESLGPNTVTFRQLGLKKQITLLKGFSANEEDFAAEQFHLKCADLLANFKRFGRFKVNVGVGRPHAGWAGIHDSYIEACEAVERTTFGQSYRLVRPKETVEREAAEPLLSPGFAELFKSACKQRDGEKAAALLDALLRTPAAQEATRGEVYDAAARLLEWADRLSRDAASGIGRDDPYIFERARLCALDGLEDIRQWVAEELRELNRRGNPVYSDPRALIRDLREFVVRHFASEEITLGLLSSKFGMNIYQICRMFKSEFNVNFHAFLTDLKMEKAKAYLRDSSMPVQDIAFMVGYKETKYFFKVFKKHVGQTPTEYRNRT
ncbi:response regulator [Cohnella sp. GbtcB17]|uniref:response regulator n=1 Tax=Cohnella sp. GbtcB17 TaxID=2824762 RepID=UPI0020C62C3F|nr:response regulator [Cohnella sp. GbtcB17]